MPTRRSQTPDLFADHLPDPVDTATGRSLGPETRRLKGRQSPMPAAEVKRKAGFYLSDELLGRFNTRFYALKLAGAAIENKSALLEAALDYALEDLARGPDSRILKRIATRSR